MRLYVARGAVTCPIKNDNFNMIYFLEKKIKNNEKIHMEELKEFIDEEYIWLIHDCITCSYDLDTKYEVRISFEDSDNDHPSCSLEIRRERNIYTRLCCIWEPSEEEIKVYKENENKYLEEIRLLKEKLMILENPPNSNDPNF